MPLHFQAFRKRFDELVLHNKMSWEAVGFLSPDDRIYAFGTDSKVISTVFEAITAPLIQQVASEFGYTINGSEQTIYPDFTLTPVDVTPSATNPCRIAIDIKTTYRRFDQYGNVKKFGYTLGSYTSFLRSPTATKNIAFPYAEYSDNLIVGFLYTRRDGVPAKVYDRADVTKLKAPYHNVEYFVQEKYKIAGMAAGSGNTANIGSFPTDDIEDLRQGRGPFSKHGKEVCDMYWRHYGKTAKERPYSTVDAFLTWRATKGI